MAILSITKDFMSDPLFLAGCEVPKEPGTTRLGTSHYCVESTTPLALRGRRVLVSGGTTGIGRATVELFVKAGARVATFARTESDIQELKRNLPDVVAFTADAANEEEMRGGIERTVTELGGIDILINNAGVAGESVTSMSYQAWKSVIEINLLGPMMLTQLAAEKMAPGTHIVTIGSMSAESRGAGSDVYVASKTGLQGFVEAVGKTLAKKGIVHTLIEPGLAESDMTTEGKTADEVRQLKEDHKMMEAEDVARSVLFVASQPPRMAITVLQIQPRLQDE